MVVLLDGFWRSDAQLDAVEAAEALGVLAHLQFCCVRTSLYAALLKDLLSAVVKDGQVRQRRLAGSAGHSLSFRHCNACPACWMAVHFVGNAQLSRQGSNFLGNSKRCMKSGVALGILPCSTCFDRKQEVSGCRRVMC